MTRRTLAPLFSLPLLLAVGCFEGDQPPPGTMPPPVNTGNPADGSNTGDDSNTGGTNGTGDVADDDSPTDTGGDTGDGTGDTSDGGDETDDAGTGDTSDDSDDNGDATDTGDDATDTGDDATDTGDDATDTGDDATDTGDDDSGTDTGDGGDTDTDTGDDGGGDDGTYAADISLTMVDFNQGLQAIIGEDGQVVAPDITLVKERPALVRAFWELGGGWSAREVEARLTLSYEDGSTEVLTDTRTISGPPDEDSLDGAFNWLLTSDQVQAGMEYSVGLFEVEDTGASPPSPLPRIPQSGTGEVGIPADDMVLEIVFVPMTLSGQSPDMSSQNVQALVDGYFNMNPVSEVRMTLHAAIAGSSTNPSSLLSQISQLRSAESPDPQVYYIGLAPVSATGWTGVSYVPGPTMNGDRSSFSPISNNPGNYPSDNSWGYTVHETGHAQGMPHNPGCNAGGPNQDWPWPNVTTIDRMGYDIAKNLLRDLDSEDYMNYCFPDWPSSFTWENTVERIQILSSWRVDATAPKQHLLRGIISHTGDAPIWWSVPGNPDTGKPQTTPIDLQVVIDSGAVVNVQGTAQVLCGEGTTSIEAVLPAAPASLQHITVVADGQAFDVEPQGLTAQYDEYVRLYGPRAD